MVSTGCLLVTEIAQPSGRMRERRQLRSRVHSDLGRDRGAVHFHRALADSQLGRDLLVHAAQNDFAEDFAFAPRQLFDAARERVAMRELIQRPANGTKQRRLRGAFLEKIDCSSPHGGYRAGNVADSREKDDRYLAPGLGERTLEAEPVHAWHLEIGDDAATSALSNVLQQFGS